MTGDLKVGYNPMYGFNRSSLATFRAFTGTTNDHFIWQAGLAPNVPNTINGEPYVLLQDMADIASNSLSVVYADFKRGYRWIDRTGLVIIRDDFTGKKEAIVELLFRKWNSGKVVLPEAFKLLKTKA
jgi:HK97 family phage major capsid protein